MKPYFTALTWTLTKKRYVINIILVGHKKKSVAEQFKISRSTLNTILNNNDYILSNTPRRNWGGMFPEIENTLVFLNDSLNAKRIIILSKTWLEGKNDRIKIRLFKKDAL